MADGEILEKKPYQFPSSVYDSGGFFLGEFEYLRHIEAYDITYMSDGLRIKGFYVVPKGWGPYPCIICNRAGTGSSARSEPWRW